MDIVKSDKTISITLKYAGSEDVTINFDPLEMRSNKWKDRLLFLPMTMPHRLVGFVHPDAEKDLGLRPVMLHGTFAFISQLMHQRTDKGIAVVEGPKAIVPPDFVSPIDMWVMPKEWFFIREQNEDWGMLIEELMKQFLVPKPRIEVPDPKLLMPKEP